MSKYKITKYYPGDKIDITRRGENEDIRERLTNTALIALRRKNLDYSQQFAYLKALIIEFNKKMRLKSVKSIVNVIRFWLTGMN